MCFDSFTETILESKLGNQVKWGNVWWIRGYFVWENGMSVSILHWEILWLAFQFGHDNYGNRWLKSQEQSKGDQLGTWCSNLEVR